MSKLLINLRQYKISDVIQMVIILYCLEGHDKTCPVQTHSKKSGLWQIDPEDAQSEAMRE